MRFAAPPLAIGILRQGTSDWPMCELIARAAALYEQEHVLSVSVVEGFPYADVAEMGMSFIAVTDDDEALADRIVTDLAAEAWRLRSEFVGLGVDVEAALVRAAASAERPVVLLDVGDNVGGGSPADSTHVLEAAQRLGIRDLFHSLCDPVAVEHCRSAGLGASVTLAVGARTDTLHGAPVNVTGRVRHLDDGTFEDTGVTHGGFRFFDAGHRALLETEDGHSRPAHVAPDGEHQSRRADERRPGSAGAAGDRRQGGALAARRLRADRCGDDPAQHRRLHDGGSLVAHLSAAPPADVPLRARYLVRPDGAGHLSATLRSGW